MVRLNLIVSNSTVDVNVLHQIKDWDCEIGLKK